MTTSPAASSSAPSPASAPQNGYVARSASVVLVHVLVCVCVLVHVLVCVFHLFYFVVVVFHVLFSTRFCPVLL